MPLSFSPLSLLCVVQRAALPLLLALLALPGQADFTVGPMEVQLKVPRPGARITSEFELYNTGTKELHISAYVSDWTKTKTGEVEIGDPGTQPNSCATWITLNPVEFNLAPKQTVKVRFTIATPADLADERHALVFFQSRPVPVKGNYNMQLAISTRFGCKVFVVPAKPLAPQGKLAGMTMSPASKLQVTFENTGAVNVRLNGTVEARGADGQLAAKGILLPVQTQVLPGGVQPLSPQWDRPLTPGVYQLRAVIDYGGKQLLGGEIKATVALPIAKPAETPDKSQTPSDSVPPTNAAAAVTAAARETENPPQETTNGL
ncbi:MAG TPA: hypothetical protein VGB77_08100 [Abditibacteriaceae bacterium]|jgi:P pilus assembly chaperone PapD